MLSFTHALEKGNKRLKVINWQLKGKKEIQRASLVAYKETFISHSLKAEKAEDQALDFIMNNRALNLGMC